MHGASSRTEPSPWISRHGTAGSTLSGDGKPTLWAGRRRCEFWQISTVTLINASTEPLTADAAPAPWREGIVTAFQMRMERGVAGYAVLGLTLDVEYLRYFDGVLIELCHADRRLLHPRSPNRAILRSAALDVVVANFIARREADTTLSGDPVNLADALNGDLGNVLFTGLLHRENPLSGPRLEAIDVLLLPGAACHLNDEVRRLVERYFSPDDRGFYLGEGFDALRSAFLEACVVTWMILNELVAEEAVPARDAFAVIEAQESAFRRRWFPRWA